MDKWIFMFFSEQYCYALLTHIKFLLSLSTILFSSYFFMFYNFGVYFSLLRSFWYLVLGDCICTSCSQMRKLPWSHYWRIGSNWEGTFIYLFYISRHNDKPAATLGAPKRCRKQVQNFYFYNWGSQNILKKKFQETNHAKHGGTASKLPTLKNWTALITSRFSPEIYCVFIRTCIHA